MKRLAGTAAFVIAAMAVGRIVTDFVPVGDSVEAPFVREGQVGRPVSLKFATVEVRSLDVTPTIVGFPVAVAGGRWLIVRTQLTAVRSPVTIQSPTLVNREGTRFMPTDRGTDCALGAVLPTGVPWQATFCFDVPRAALDGARILIARGEYLAAGDGFRRDDVASVDLGTTAALWDRTAAIDVVRAGVDTETGGR